METCAVRRVSIAVDGTGSFHDGPATEGLNLLIVTRDEDLSAAAARALTAEGYHVSTASHSGHAVLACLTSHRVDVVLAELALDDMSGQALANTLRRHHPELRTLFMAPAGTPAREGIIVRPFTRDGLLAELRALTGSAISTTAS